MKNNPLKHRIYFGICIFVDIVLFCFFLCTALFGAADKDDFLILIPFAVTFFLVTAISVFYLIRTIKNKAEKPVLRSVTLKLCVIPTGFAFSFITIEDGIYAFSLFLFVGIVFGFLFFVVERKPAVTCSGKAAFKPEYHFKYKGKWVWDDAAREFMRLNGIDRVSELREDENDKIYDYTATPLSYFFYWLHKSGFLNENFYSDCPEEMILDLISEKVTPVDILGAMDYYFSDEYMIDEIKHFVATYYDSSDGNIFSADIYLYDYFECLGFPEGRYYCNDFSWDILHRLTAKIDERYEKYKSNFFPSDSEYYNDDETGIRAHSAMFGELEVYKIGKKLTGEFPEGYTEMCIHALDNLSPLQIKKLERYFNDYYRDCEDEPITLNQFRADALYIMEPREVGDIVFMVSGEADFEEEHGVSFIVRNGIIIDCGYAYDFDDPYSDENLKLYAIPNLDFTAISTERETEKYISTGELIKARLLPDIKNCRFTAEEEYVYLTPKALEEKNKLDSFIKGIIAYAGRDDMEISYSVNYQVDGSNQKESVVPRSIYIRSTNKNFWVHMSFGINIWN